MNGDMTSPPEWGEPTSDIELWNFETEQWERLDEVLKMYNAEMDFTEAMKSLEKEERQFYLSVYWADYAEVHKN